MRSIESIMKDIDNLPVQDLEVLLQKIAQKVNESSKIQVLLSEYKGSGKGIWPADVQRHINNLRTDDRV